MYNELPAPIACGMCGALAGLFGGGFSQCFPIWVGAATGAGVGCLMCIVHVLMPERTPLPVAQPVRVDPVIVQNFFVLYTGQAKELIPVDSTAVNLKQVENNGQRSDDNSR